MIRLCIVGKTVNLANKSKKIKWGNRRNALPADSTRFPYTRPFMFLVENIIYCFPYKLSIPAYYPHFPEHYPNSGESFPGVSNDLNRRHSVADNDKSSLWFCLFSFLSLLLSTAQMLTSHNESEKGSSKATVHKAALCHGETYKISFVLSPISLPRTFWLSPFLVLCTRRCEGSLVHRRAPPTAAATNTHPSTCSLTRHLSTLLVQLLGTIPCLRCEHA